MIAAYKKEYIIYVLHKYVYYIYLLLLSFRCTMYFSAKYIVISFVKKRDIKIKQTNNLIELSPSLTCFARSGGTPKLERTLIQCVLIRGMCQLRVRAARRRENGAPSLTDSTSDCAVWVRSWRTKRSDISREMPYLCEC